MRVSLASQILSHSVAAGLHMHVLTKEFPLKLLKLLPLWIKWASYSISLILESSGLINLLDGPCLKEINI